MSHTMTCWLQLLSLHLVLLNGAPGAGCPARCECAPQLRSVVCHRRRLTAIPEGIPTETRILELSRNRIRCLNPGDLAPYPLLEELDLSENIIAHVEPGAFGNLLHLQTLRLRGNQLKLIPPGVFTKLSNLTLLDLSENKLVILLDHMFQDLRNLKRLEVGDNDLVFISQRAFSGLLALEELTLERCNLTTLSGESLAHLQNLGALRLRYLGIPALEEHNFRRLPGLLHLEIDNWPLLEEVTASSLQGLNLSSLSVTYTNISAVPAAALRHLAYLTSLNLSYNPISTVPRGSFRDLVRLRELHLAGALLAVVEPQAFLGLRQIRLLNLSNNLLATLEESTFHSVNTLETLRVDGNPLACDCRLLWIVQRRKTLNFDGRLPSCASPAEVRGDALRALPDSALFEYFVCRKPKIRERRLQHVTATEGQAVSFFCRAEGEPEPSITWVTPQHRVVAGAGGDRTRVLVGGTLEIREAQAQDSGTYVCVASNAGGNDTYFATLMVRPGANRTLGPGEPGDLAARNDTQLPRFPLDLTTILVSTAMGCITFLGVVLFCFLLLFVWSRGRGQHKSNFSVEYSFRKVDGPAAAAGQGGARKFNMKMI
ncbi:leucine-rich repeat and immunoglobulin-like domain-containing nogo receptor-interacting protein 3 [Dromiciops gliroides]|uniref:leucine-rich repeat and immunoglobulin-like domain-containing nogo receptor-interacting protein 3 n=1 Tax=Dromiciops gliroides TaxID=33562 RepID=UPI001CC483EC|nr:leucine-rich repeat and immunoglobulin-like domain-containing nogo receptor-interacting protein 3 [Dromiciops gliroides]XP_043831603.1 leucine-rich repeat and immunoglobulin-like domain-containing nogo receptor-interacting protein 3 [Dromiciops gliroides]XP_043831604.1 leucine-rich repeat and immunoglobulin-like domain-containing nogo receptor-interacting protein 3 [Dromiciops gliroides]XP_043831605.1 leucine-rich repeat and immunoglobulin-like domain-containing nogo receptor-interacting prot